jgi:hypothetical protein
MIIKTTQKVERGFIEELKRIAIFKKCKSAPVLVLKFKAAFRFR